MPVTAGPSSSLSRRPDLCRRQLTRTISVAEGRRLLGSVSGSRWELKRADLERKTVFDLRGLSDKDGAGFVLSVSQNDDPTPKSSISQPFSAGWLLPAMLDRQSTQAEDGDHPRRNSGLFPRRFRTAAMAAWHRPSPRWPIATRYSRRKEQGGFPDIMVLKQSGAGQLHRPIETWLPIDATWISIRRIASLQLLTIGAA